MTSYFLELKKLFFKNKQKKKTQDLMKLPPFLYFLLFHFLCTSAILPSFKGCENEQSKSYPYCDTKLSISDRVSDLLSHFNLTEKIQAISPQEALGNTCGTHTYGKESIGLPNYFWLTETNSGVASKCLSSGVCATAYPGPLGTAASFNRTLWRQKGEAFGKEMRSFNNAGWPRGTGDQDLIGLTGYGPNMNIARDPRFGRTSELPGEDPYLTGQYAKEMVIGMQKKDAHGHPLMLAYLKHFMAYSRETDRGHDTYNISLHDMFDTYLPHYETVFVDGGATGAMCSYNGENGVPSCANDFILNQIIRKKWNRPDAHITTDCGAVENLLGAPVFAPSHEAAAAWSINNGTDIEMGSVIWSNFMESAVKNGLVSEETINTAFRRSYTPHFIAGRFDPMETVEWTKIGTEVISSPEHKTIAFESAVQGFVLLKNDNLLPIAKGKKIAVVGPIAVSGYSLLDDYFVDEVCSSGGYDCIMTIGQAIEQVNKEGVTSVFKGVDINSNDTSGIDAALEACKNSDVVVLTLGIDRTIEEENVDRIDTALPGLQEKFALQVLALKKPTVLVLVNGGALAIDHLILGPDAIVESYNPSVNGGLPLAETLFGMHNRWGKLVTTMYRHSFITENPMENFDMSLSPGRTYRYYQNCPLYAFGHGLSYTSFNMNCEESSKGSFEYNCNVNNTGNYDGDEVILVYHSAGQDIRDKVNYPVPIKSLINFERIFVKKSMSENVKFKIYEKDLMLVNNEGEKTLEYGKHNLIFSRGNGLEVIFEITISENKSFLEVQE